MIDIIPSILTNNLGEIEEKLARLADVVKRVQIDIVDGQFAKNRTIDPSALENIETDLSLDFHLMTKEPLDWIERAVRGGAETIIGQIEKMTSQIDFVGKVAEVGLKVGLAVNIETAISELDPAILTNLDVVLLMSYPAGIGGQPFDRRVLTKIKQLKEIQPKDETPFLISVDGGINETTLTEVIEAGADRVVIGESLFTGSVTDNIKRLAGKI